MKKTILIRTDSSYELGLGHLHRCLVLAELLRENGCDVEFACKDLNGNQIDIIAKKKFKIHFLSSQNIFDWERDLAETFSILQNDSKKYDWIIVDNYFLDYRWETPFYEAKIKILVIDDLAISRHQCHYLLNPTFHVNEEKYFNLVSSETRLLLGEQYILLKPEFRFLKEKYYPRLSKDYIKLHIFFGGYDLKDYTYEYSKMLLQHFDNLILTIIKNTNDDPKWKALQREYDSRIALFKYVENMADNLWDCDLCLGAPGITTWERASLGLPAIYLATNKNQVDILNHLQNEKLCFFLGMADSISENNFIHSMKNIFKKSEELKEMGKLGFEKIDGLGVNRTVEIILKA